MMKLSLMKKIFETVNSDWDCELAKELVKNWDHDDQWIKMWRASANVVCFFKKGDSQYVLRFNKNTEKNKNDLMAEVNLLNYLDSKSIPLAKPVLSNNNKYVHESHTDYGTFYSMAFERIFGEQKEFEDMDLNSYYKWGKLLGQLHEVIKKRNPSVEIKRKTHQDLLEELVTLSPNKNKIEETEYAQLKKWLDSLSRNKNNYGLIHYDFELDNLIWNEQGITIIDFDDSIYSWYIADIAYAFRDLFEEGEQDNSKDEGFQKFLKGYKSQTELAEEELLQLLPFFRLHNFMTYKKLQRAMDLEKSKDHPDWLNDLIDKLKTKYLDRYFKNFKIHKNLEKS